MGNGGGERPEGRLRKVFGLYLAVGEFSDKLVIIVFTCVLSTPALIVV